MTNVDDKDNIKSKFRRRNCEEAPERGWGRCSMEAATEPDGLAQK